MEIVAKLKSFIEITVKLVKLEKPTWSEGEVKWSKLEESLKYKLLPSLDDLLFDLHEGRDVMLDDLEFQTSEEDQFRMAATCMSSKRASFEFGDIHEINGLALLLSDHVRKFSQYLTFDTSALLCQVECSFLAVILNLST